MLLGVSNDDVFASVRAELRQLERGVRLHDPKVGHDVLFCGLLAYLKGDMPEMCKCCGHVGVSGEEFCRSCRVTKDKASDGGYDIFVNQRDQAQMDAVRQAMREEKSITKINEMRKNTGAALHC